MKKYVLTLWSETKTIHNTHLQMVVNNHMLSKHLPHIYVSFSNSCNFEPVKYCLSKDDIMALARICALEFRDSNLTYCVADCLYDKCAKHREVYMQIEPRKE